MKMNIKKMLVGVSALCLCSIAGLGISNIKTANASAEATTTVESFKAESVALRVPNATYGKGLRFTFVISEDDYTQYNVATNTTGVLLVPQALLGEAELTVDSTNENVIKKEGITWVSSENGGYETYVHVYDIPTDYYTSPLTVRAYVDDADTATAPVYSASASMSVAEAADWAYDNDTTLDATEKAELQATYLTYPVNYYVNDTLYVSATGVYGETITAPTQPTAEVGYQFDGWFNKSGTAQWDFATGTIGGVQTNLYAKMTKIQYTVAVEGGTTDKETYTYGETVTLSPTVENFLYWKVNGEKIEGDTFTLTGETTVTAVVKQPATGGATVFYVAGTSVKAAKESLAKKYPGYTFTNVTLTQGAAGTATVTYNPDSTQYLDSEPYSATVYLENVQDIETAVALTDKTQAGTYFTNTSSGTYDSSSVIVPVAAGSTEASGAAATYEVTSSFKDDDTLRIKGSGTGYILLVWHTSKKALCSSANMNFNPCLYINNNSGLQYTRCDCAGGTRVSIASGTNYITNLNSTGWYWAAVNSDPIYNNGSGTIWAYSTNSEGYISGKGAANETFTGENMNYVMAIPLYVSGSFDFSITLTF